MQRPSAQLSNAATIEEIMITDIISSICKHILDIKTLSRLCTTNKQFAKYLLSPAGDTHWVKAGKLVCGDEFWYNNHFSETPENFDFFYFMKSFDGLYQAKVHICPWLLIQQQEEIPDEDMMFHEIVTTSQNTEEDALLAELKADKSFLAKHGELEAVSIINRGSFVAMFRLQQSTMDLRFFSMHNRYRQLWHIAVANGKPYTFSASPTHMSCADLPGRTLIRYQPDFLGHKRLLI